MSIILPSKVAEGGFTRLLERLGRDCGPIQFIREFFYNCVEAILRTGEKGQILIDVNWDLYDAHGFYKMSFTDTGIGMTRDELLTLVKDLSSSGEKNQYENYGLGAKISAMTRNPEGIYYESWKDGVGHAVLLRYDKDSDQYGCEQFRLSDNSYAHYRPLSDAEKPNIINDHGTRVTLMGTGYHDDTMQLPVGVKLTKESWIYRCINERFYEIDPLVECKVRVGYERPRSDTKHNHLLKPSGQKSVYLKHAKEFGIVNISDAKVHWFILNEDRQGHGRDYVAGNTAILHQGELFDRTDGRSNRAQMFGIIFGASNVVLIVEPEGEYNQNVQRTALQRLDGRAMPWERWSDEFKANMPKALNDYVQSIIAKASKDSHDSSIAERLKKYAKFYQVSRYKPSPQGKYEVDDELMVSSQTGFGSGGSGSGGSGGGEKKKQRKKPGSISDLLSPKIKAGGIPATKAAPNPFPRVDWVTLENGTRDQGEMEDRAATYINSENLVKANKDFLGFRDVINHYLKEYEGIMGASEVIPDTIMEWFEQQLVETVAGVLSLRNRKLWTDDHIETALSDESLTACIMQRFHLLREVNRLLRAKLGKPSSEQNVA
ncbi:ATP-binding protein [Ferrimonas balearica]|uniref:ATP-binding protein n=1 Tax=Ferrimonas balearica TaxID=44012 RepID=UPI001C988756|nr:ATP-binding protein [Ferrimonas balearica]MBY6107698.1 ATP-binding protein [Ferrimonas balearica]